MNLTRYQRPDLAWAGFGRLSSLRDELDRLFESPWAELTRTSQLLSGWTPALDVHEDKDILQAEPKVATERTAQQEFVTPVVNIFETKDGYTLEAEIPGVNNDGLEITLAGNEITLAGRRAAVAVTGELLFQERPTADYRRVFEFDPAIDTSRISAKMKQGMLTLALPKSERVQPRKIAVSE